MGRPDIVSGEDSLLTPAETAALFRVKPRTLNNWVRDGLLGRVQTPGGHNRYRESEVRSLLEGEPDGQQDANAGA